MAGTTSSGRRGRHEMISAINVTPLVDVVLVLLIIVMVTSTYIVAHTLKVELPKTKSSDGPGGDPAVLTLLHSGELRWNDAEITEARVEAAIRAEVEKRGAIELVISADEKVEHGRVVRFIDLAKLAGVTKFAINVERAR